MSNNQPILSCVQANENAIEKYWWLSHEAAASCNSAALSPGDTCPNCIAGTLDYDGLFLLTCNLCGKVAEGGAFT